LSRPITVKIVRLEKAGTEVPLPVKMTAHAAGFDVCAAVRNPVTIKAGAIEMIPCGFAMAIPHGYEAQMRPRSGLASKFGITLPNAPGTIDSDYRGEVKVPLINHGKKPFVVERGMRIAQMLIAPVQPAVLKEVKSLDATARGSRGFGHTGH
jgi:dUTP pyrophosphatase